MNISNKDVTEKVLEEIKKKYFPPDKMIELVEIGITLALKLGREQWEKEEAIKAIREDLKH